MLKFLKTIVTLKRLASMSLAFLVAFLVRNIIIIIFGLNPELYLDFIIIYMISALSVMSTIKLLNKFINEKK